MSWLPCALRTESQDEGFMVIVFRQEKDEEKEEEGGKEGEKSGRCKQMHQQYLQKASDSQEEIACH